MKYKIFQRKWWVIGIVLVLLWLAVLIYNHGPQLWQGILAMHGQ